MNIISEHDVVYDFDHRIYWVRLNLIEGGITSTVIIGAGKNYIADHYAGTENISNEHIEAWKNEAIEYVQSLSSQIFLINSPFRKIYADTSEGVQNGTAFLQTIIV